MFPFREIRVLCAGGDAERSLVRYASMLAGLAPDASIRYLEAGSADAAAGADLLLCAGGLRRKKFWSKWIASAPCSVWLVPPGAPALIRGLLVSIDPQPAAREALRVAAAVAGESRLDRCVALHMYHIDGSICCDQCEVEMRERKAAEVATFVARVDSPGVDVQVTVEESLRPALTLSRSLNGHDADLLVLSAPQRAPLFGCGLDSLIVEAGVPVLVVRSLDGPAGETSFTQKLRLAPFALFRRSTA